jgi:dUTP pyrophosphatase
VNPFSQHAVRTDIAIQIPQGYYGRIAPRSGLALRHCIQINAGVVDQDYRGNIIVILYNAAIEPFLIKKGERIAQLILEKIDTPELIQVDRLDDTLRGADGFGSTGNI